MKKVIGVIVIAFLVAHGWTLASAANPPSQDRAAVIEKLDKLRVVDSAVSNIKTPKMTQPKWYKQQVAAAEKSRQSTSKSGGNKTVTYTVKTKGSTKSNLAQFSAMANQTLNSSRGWGQLGFKFKEVSSGGSFHLILSEASQVPSFSSGCSAEWSCRVGVSVIINDDRWQGATDAWNEAGGDIRGYRHMVINHEVGHWLGHDHATCPAKGAYAPVMLQQSIDLEGCKFNPWPLTGELWSSR